MGFAADQENWELFDSILGLEDAPLQEMGTMLAERKDKDILLRVVKIGHEDLATQLLEAGSAVSEEHLFEAAKHGWIKFCESLIENHEVDPDAKDGGSTRTFLYFATEAGQADLVRHFLSQKPAWLNDNMLGTVVFMSLYSDVSNIALAIEVLQGDDPVNITWWNSDTQNECLHYAALKAVDAPEWRELVRLLIVRGFDTTKKNKAGQTPIELAADQGKAWLVKHMAKCCIANGKLMGKVDDSVMPIADINAARQDRFLEVLNEGSVEEFSDLLIQLMKDQVNVVSERVGGSLLVQFLQKLHSKDVRAQVAFLARPFSDDQTAVTADAEAEQDIPKQMIQLDVIQEHLHHLDVKAIMHHWADRHVGAIFNVLRDSFSQAAPDAAADDDYVKFQRLCELQFRVVDRSRHYEEDSLTKNRQEKITVCHHLAGILHTARKKYLTESNFADVDVLLRDFMNGLVRDPETSDTKSGQVTTDMIEKAQDGTQVRGLIYEASCLLDPDARMGLIIADIKSQYPGNKAEWSDLLRRGLRSSVAEKKAKAQVVVQRVCQLGIQDKVQFLLIPRGWGLMNRPLVVDAKLVDELANETVVELIDYAIAQRDDGLCAQLKAAVEAGRLAALRAPLLRRWQIARVLIRLYNLHDKYLADNSSGNHDKMAICCQLIHRLSGQDPQAQQPERPSVIDNQHLNLKDYLGGVTLGNAKAGAASELQSILGEIKRLNDFVVRGARGNSVVLMSALSRRPGDRDSQLGQMDYDL